MSNAFLDAIDAAAALAGTAQYRAVTTSPDYGSDILCGDDATPTFDEVPGDSGLAVGYAVWRAITSARGSIPGAPDRGYDVRDLLRKPATRSELATWAPILRSEILRDDRVASCDVTVRRGYGDLWTIEIRGVVSDGAGGFELTGELSPGGALLKEIQA